LQSGKLIRENGPLHLSHDQVRKISHFTSLVRELLLPGRPDVLLGDDDVVELDDVDLILGPTVGDLALQSEGVGHEAGCLPPVDAAPVPAKPAIDPVCLLAVALPIGVVLEHEFAADPFAFCDVRMAFWLELIAPVFLIGRGFHLVPIAIEIPLPWGRAFSPVTPGLESGRKSLVALRL
jgi:hypothetical protein